MTSEQSLTDAIAAATPKDALAIARALEQAGYKAWLVGGCVRDLIRSWAQHPAAKQPADFDLCTDARPEVVQRTFRRVIPTGIAHGTVTVVLGGRHFEVTTLRGERGYTDGRHPDEVFFVSDLELDLARRDFTVNAMAFDICEPKLVDPFGGQQDLERGVLRAVGDPLARFSEDGLRVLRCARFSATLELDVEPATQAAMRPSLASFAKVAGERVREEWLKALRSRAPSRAFRLLRSEGLLGITCPSLFPEGSPAADSAYEAACQLLDHADAEAIFRLALLVLRAASVPGNAPNDAPATSARGLCLELSRSLKLSGAEKSRLCSLAEPASELLAASVDLSEPALMRRFMRRVGPDFVQDVGRLCVQASATAAERARLADVARRLNAELVLGPPLALKDLALTGGELIAALELKPGPDVGRLLERLLEATLDDPAHNDKERLLSLARRLK